VGGQSYLLDLTRLTSRLGRGVMTGIDRVELAYLQHFLDMGGALHGLVRTRMGYVLLDRAGCAGLCDLATGARNLPALPFWLRPFAQDRARGAWAVHRAAMAAVGPRALPRLLRKLPATQAYLNVGHSNLTAAVLAAIGQAGLRRAVMIHDTIPLDHP